MLPASKCRVSLRSGYCQLELRGSVIPLSAITILLGKRALFRGHSLQGSRGSPRTRYVHAPAKTDRDRCTHVAPSLAQAGADRGLQRDPGSHRHRSRRRYLRTRREYPSQERAAVILSLSFIVYNGKRGLRIAAATSREHRDPPAKPPLCSHPGLRSTASPLPL